jgi:hypothetical protein
MKTQILVLVQDMMLEAERNNDSVRANILLDVHQAILKKFENESVPVPSEEQEEPTMPKCSCGGNFEFNRYCGADVCPACDNHKGFARCFCGWAESGGDGRAELEEMGETIEPEDY